MDRVNKYLDLLSPLVVVALVFAAAIVVLAIPKRRRLHVALVAMVVSTMIGQMQELPGQGVAKISIVLSYVLVCVTALLHPGPRRKLPGVVMWWPILAVFAAMFVLYADNAILAIALRIEFLFLVLAAIMTFRVMTDREAADQVARALGIGLMLGVLVATTALAVQGKKAFYLGRLDPYGANSNQIGVVFAVAVPMSLYVGIRAKHFYTRWPSIFMAALSATLVVITASRSSVVVTGIMVMPFLFSGFRRSAIVLGLVGLAVVVGIAFLYDPEAKPQVYDDKMMGLERLSSVDTPRYELFTRYLNESISKRPFVGLLGSSENSVLRDEDIGMHPHNAYLEMMYLGGILYTLPHLFLIAATVLATFYVLRRRKQVPADPLLVALLGAILFAVYPHGFVNGCSYYPTSTWAVFHVLASVFMLSTAADLRKASRLRRQQAHRNRNRLVLVGASLSALVALTACCGSSNGKDKQPTQAQPTTRQQNGPPGAPLADSGAGTADSDDGVADDAALPVPEIDDYRHVGADKSAATPDVLCGVKLDKPEDGPEVRKQARALRMPMVLVAYQWIVDYGKDGRFDDEDKKRFTRWMDINVPLDSHQLITIDFEKPYWKELRNYRDLPPERLKQITAVYREILAFAKSKRPNVRWGFYGLPARQYAMKDGWKQRIRELGEQLLRNQDVVFLAIYDNRIGDRQGRDLTAIRTYVELTLAEARGRPVYAYARGRYMGRPQKGEWIPDDEFRQNLEAALDARWNDGTKEHKLAGIIFWDGLKDRNRAKPATPQELDKLYAHQMKIVNDTVRAKRGRPGLSVPPKSN